MASFVVRKREQPESLMLINEGWPLLSLLIFDPENDRFGANSAEKFIILPGAHAAYTGDVRDFLGGDDT